MFTLISYNLISFLLLSIAGHDSHGRWPCSFLGYSWGATKCRHQSGSECNWTTRGDANINPFTSTGLSRSYTKCLITTFGGTSKERHTILGCLGDIISVGTLKLCYLIGLDIPLTTLTCCGRGRWPRSLNNNNLNRRWSHWIGCRIRSWVWSWVRGWVGRGLLERERENGIKLDDDQLEKDRLRQTREHGNNNIINSPHQLELE